MEVEIKAGRALWKGMAVINADIVLFPKVVLVLHTCEKCECDL